MAVTTHVMWSQMQQGRLLRKICEYISGTDRRRVDMVGVRDGKNYASEHFTRHARLLHELYRWNKGYWKIIGGHSGGDNYMGREVE